jgi:glutamyl-Q tRNA(Asp) synthetase
MEVVTRFAPSPTGRLHLGHGLSAVRAFDLARAAGGRFLLRIEDIDGTRSRPEHVDAILADLEWLGLEWEGPVFQSGRLGLYAAALERLKARGLVYPCFCTRTDIAAASASAPHGVGTVYPGTCRGLPVPDVSRPHCWRLDAERTIASLRLSGASRGGTEAVGGTVWWHDATAGPVRADPARHGDVILARKDAPASYHLAVTVDDAAQGVTDVVRGVDLFAATDVHRLLQALLGLPTPRYHHHPLLTGPDGLRLAKRHGAPTLEGMRLAGVDGLLVANRLRMGELPTGFGRAES